MNEPTQLSPDVSAIPVVIEFAPGSRIGNVASPHYGDSGDGFFDEAGTFIEFTDGRRVSVPTDQLVLREDGDGGARIGFGGMSFEGLEKSELVFFRVRDLLPEDRLDPFRSDKVSLSPDCVVSIKVQGAQVWPRA